MGHWVLKYWESLVTYQSTRSCSVFCSEVKRNDLRSWNDEALILGFSIEFQQVIPGSVISNENVRVLKVFQFDISCEFLIRYSVCVEEEEFYGHLLSMSYSPIARSFRSSFTRHFLSVFSTTLKFFFTKASVSTCIWFTDSKCATTVRCTLLCWQCCCDTFISDHTTVWAERQNQTLIPVLHLVLDVLS
jgi:hypothetical protein